MHNNNGLWNGVIFISFSLHSFSLPLVHHLVLLLSEIYQTLEENEIIYSA